MDGKQKAGNGIQTAIGFGSFIEYIPGGPPDWKKDT